MDFFSVILGLNTSYVEEVHMGVSGVKGVIRETKVIKLLVISNMAISTHKAYKSNNQNTQNQRVKTHRPH